MSTVCNYSLGQLSAGCPLPNPLQRHPSPLASPNLQCQQRGIRPLHFPSRAAFRPNQRNVSARVTDSTVDPKSSNGSIRTRAPETISLPEAIGSWSLVWRQTTAMFSAGAVLGPLLDGRHSAQNVLHYEDPWVLQWGDTVLLETCWWVPLLFGVAAVILGLSHPLLDRWQPLSSPPGGPLLLREPAKGAAPPWTAVMGGIALFALHYDFSGFLDGRLELAHPLIDLVLLGTALKLWWDADRTAGGLCMACLTAAGGPALEVALINGGHLYTYTHADVWGIPTWIPWVYFSGASAVGNLGRRVRADLEDSLAQQS